MKLDFDDLNVTGITVRQNESIVKYLWTEKEVVSNGDKKISALIVDETCFNKRAFILYVEDTSSPCMDLVLSDSWEEAYECYKDWAADNRNIKISDQDLDDYDGNEDVTSTGIPIDTESIKGFEVKIVSIDCE